MSATDDQLSQVRAAAQDMTAAELQLERTIIAFHEAVEEAGGKTREVTDAICDAISTAEELHAMDTINRQLKWLLAEEEFELWRCVNSITGSLSAIRDRMASSPEALALSGVIEGGIPEMEALAAKILQGRRETPSETAARSWARGYQCVVLLAREEQTGRRDPEAWKEDPEVFVARERGQAVPT